MRRLVVLLLLSSSSVASFAQARNASITGLVADPSGARVSGAKINAVNTLTDSSREVLTNSDGEYNLVELPPGPYKVRASAAGFQEQERINIVLDVEQTARLDFALQIGTTQSVVVLDTPPLLESQSSEVGTVIDNRKVLDLPLNGRQFYSLALLAPGSLPPAQNSTNGYRGGFNVAGQAETANNFYVNGIIDVDEIANYPSFRPSIEAIQEFKLLTGTYPAEYGLRPGGQVEVVIKGGGSKLRGDLFEFLRNQITDAKPYFLTTGGIPALKQNQFGATLGGPIWKNRTFFFASYEGIRLRQGVAVLTTVPASNPGDLFNMKNGDFRALLSLPTPVHVYEPGTKTDFPTPNLITSGPAGDGIISAFGQTIVNTFPNATFATPAGAAPSNNFLDTDVSRESGNESSLRIDHKLAEKDQLFLNYNLFNDPNYGAYTGQCGLSVLPGFGCDQTTVSQVLAIGETHTITSSLINEFRIGGNRYHQRRSVDPLRVGFWDLLNTNGAVPQPGGAGLTVSTTNYPGLTFGMVPNNRYDTAKQVSDSISLIRGKHSFKAGYTLINNLAVYVHNIQGSGTLTFTPSATQSYDTTGYDLADILIGSPSASTYSPYSAAVNTHPTVTNNMFYVQDDWSVTPNLTLNVGLRYELGTPIHSTDGMVSGFDPTIPGGGFRIANGQNGTQEYLYHEDKNDFAPRVGLAYRPFRNDRTVLRAGSGIYFNSAPTTTTGLGGIVHQYPFTNHQSYSFTANKTNTVLTLGNPFPITGPGVQPTTGIGFNPKTDTPYIVQYSLGVQQALTNRLTLDVSYLGSDGVKLYNTININQPPPAVQTQAQANAARPFPAWGNITWAESGAHASYNALLTKVQQSYGNGLSFIASFTYAKAIDDSAGIISAGDSSKALPQDSYDLAAENGPSDFDIKDRLVLSPVYELPFGKGKPWLQDGLGSKIIGGWQLSGIFSTQTGTPFTVYDGGSYNNFSDTYQLADRPNYVSNPNVGGAKTAKQWFNTAAFAAQPKGAFGTSGRNTVRGPHYTDLDATIVRRFPIYETADLEFRVEGFNLANHPNLYNPNSTSAQFGTQAFGTITNAYAPRQLQFALKLEF